MTIICLKPLCSGGLLRKLLVERRSLTSEDTTAIDNWVPEKSERDKFDLVVVSDACRDDKGCDSSYSFGGSLEVFGGGFKAALSLLFVAESRCFLSCLASTLEQRVLSSYSAFAALYLSFSSAACSWYFFRFEGASSFQSLAIVLPIVANKSSLGDAADVT